MIRGDFFTLFIYPDALFHHRKTARLKPNQHLSVCTQTRSHAAEKKILPVLPPEFFYKIADHTGNPKTDFRKLDQKIHSCYFQNVA